MPDDLVLVCGDRDWIDEGLIEKRLSQLPPGTTIVHGAARGADTLAGTVAKRLGFKVIPMPAKWTLYGKAAGPIRNREMLDLKPRLVIAFHPNLERSRGTKDCVTEAKRRGITTELIGEEE